jgi:recombination protein RecR
MALFEGPIQDLVDELGRLPGVGPKSAQRIAFHLLKSAKEDALRLARSIVEVTEKTVICENCFNITTAVRCSICTDSRRDGSKICVSGRYHVLGGALYPIEGIGPEQLRIRELLARIDAEDTKEVILCTNPNLEGDTTAMYLARLLGPLGISVTRIASGLPVGGDLEYADELTLGRALEGRREVGA